MKPSRETELSAPVKAFLVERGYDVNAEVKGLDIVARRGDEVIAVELKRTVSIALLRQAIKRRRVADAVYVAVPAPGGGVRNRVWRETAAVIRQLDLGLLTVTFLRYGAPRVDLVFHPGTVERRINSRARRAIIREADGRSSDSNAAGSVGSEIMTAYREAALFVACCLKTLGPSSPRDVVAAGADDKAPAILGRNYYGWFNRTARGVYELDPAGEAAIERYSELSGAMFRVIALRSDQDS